MSADSASTQVRWVTCPGCGGDSLYSPQNPWRPFCSERCRQIDLGAWASEAFRVQVQEEPQEHEEFPRESRLDGSGLN
jgi:hypothetical protein